MKVNDKPRMAVFDCDGTLVDSQHVIVACMHKAFAGEGLGAPTVAAVRQIIGLPLAECVARLAPGEETLRHDRLVEAYKDAFFSIRQQPEHCEPLFEGALAALDAVEADGWLLGIATGKSKRGCSRFWSSTIWCAASSPCRPATWSGKPDPAMLERAMEETALRARTW